MITKFSFQMSNHTQKEIRWAVGGVAPLPAPLEGFCIHSIQFGHISVWLMLLEGVGDSVIRRCDSVSDQRSITVQRSTAT